MNEELEEKLKIIKELEQKFDDLSIHYLYTKKYNKECPFDFIVNRMLTTTIVHTKEDIKNIQKAIYDRNTSLSEIIDCIIYIDNEYNKYVILTNTIDSIAKWYFDIIENNKKYKNNLDKWTIFTCSNKVRATRKYNPSYSEDNLLQNLKEKIDQLQRIPKTSEVKSPSISNYYSSFGSYNNALEILGYTPNKRRVSNIEQEKDRLLKILQDYYKKHKTIPYIKDIDKSSSIVNYFGSWSNALKEAKLTNNEYYYKNHFKITSNKRAGKKKSIQSTNIDEYEYLDAIKLLKEKNISPSDLITIINFIDLIKNK